MKLDKLFSRWSNKFYCSFLNLARSYRIKCFPQSSIDGTKQAYADIVAQFKKVADVINADKGATPELKAGLAKIQKDVDDLTSYFESHSGRIDPEVVFKKIQDISTSLLDLTSKEGDNLKSESLDVEINDSLKDLIDEFQAAVDVINKVGGPSKEGQDLMDEIQADIDDIKKYIKDNPGKKDAKVASAKIRATGEKIAEFLDYEQKLLKKKLLEAKVDKFLSKISNVRKSASSFSKTILKKIEDGLNYEKAKFEKFTKNFDFSGVTNMIQKFEDMFNKFF